jgi:hypothetical protein
MKPFDKKVWAKYTFMAIAVGIVISFLVISNRMVEDLAKEERQKIELWAEAINVFATGEENSELDITLKILSANTTIPVILCNERDSVIMELNIGMPKHDSIGFLKKKIVSFKKTNKPIVVENPAFRQYVYYGESSTLKHLQYYPFVQIGILAVFVCVSFFALLSVKNAEQNKVWVGLSKETAHQLGTPISSMLAWIEYLKANVADADAVEEMKKDVIRLQVVADRFSKIGSKPATELLEMKSKIIQSVDYMRTRISKKVVFVFNMPDYSVYANISSSLFSWVIENLTKNAVDAMEGKGTITYTLTTKGDKLRIDIKDTGKGLPKGLFKEVFLPGFTTKERGWGLGLSLAKRIIEDYHQGKIYVKSSEQNVGTVFRIELNLAKLCEIK